MHAVINRIRLKEPLDEAVCPAAIDRMRDEIGNEWMRAHVVPHAAGPPERVLGEVIPVFERD